LLHPANDDRTPILSASELGVAFTEISDDDRAVVRDFAERVRPPLLYDE
jgi:hypothetical protein